MFFSPCRLWLWELSTAAGAESWLRCASDRPNQTIKRYFRFYCSHEKYPLIVRLCPSDKLQLHARLGFLHSSPTRLFFLSHVLRDVWLLPLNEAPRSLIHKKAPFLKMNPHKNDKQCVFVLLQQQSMDGRWQTAALGKSLSESVRVSLRKFSGSVSIQLSAAPARRRVSRPSSVSARRANPSLCHINRAPIGAEARCERLSPPFTHRPRRKTPTSPKVKLHLTSTFHRSSLFFFLPSLILGNFFFFFFLVVIVARARDPFVFPVRRSRVTLQSCALTSAFGASLSGYSPNNFYRACRDSSLSRAVSAVT